MAEHLAPRFAVGRFLMSDNILLDHLGRELPQGLSGGRIRCRITMRSVEDSYSTSFAMNCSSVECRARMALMARFVDQSC
jgi:hypothetical protein